MIIKEFVDSVCEKLKVDEGRTRRVENTVYGEQERKSREEIR